MEITWIVTESTRDLTIIFYKNSPNELKSLNDKFYQMIYIIKKTKFFLINYKLLFISLASSALVH